MTRRGGRLTLLLAGIAGMAGIALGGWAYGRHEARSAPVIVRYDVSARPGHCPARPLHVAVLSDLHVSARTIPPAAITVLVARVNALHPDLVLLVGDYLGQDWPADRHGVAEALAPLGGLRSRLGTAAVLGNHDWEDGPDTIAAALTAQGIHVLRNDAWVTPDVAVLGIEELISNAANPVLVRERYAKALAKRRQAKPPLELWLAHQPIMFDRVAETGDLFFAGHTHGAQILPAISVPLGRFVVRQLRALGYKASWPAEIYVRGFYRDGAKRMLVTSGVGVSGPQIRLGVPPEIMRVTIEQCRAG